MSGTLGTALAMVAAGVGGSVWRFNLRQASFRGVPFHFERAAGTYGRRYAMHEYPGRDEPYAEDLGRAQRTWTFQAYLIGDTYHLQRTALLAACEEAGPGSLILPMIGRVNAVCTNIDFDDARQRGRYSALSLSFAEAGERLVPIGYEDSQSLIAMAAQALGEAAQEQFIGGFQVGNPYNPTITPMSAAVTAGAESILVNAAALNVIALAEQIEALRLPSYDYDQAPLLAAIEVLIKQARTLVYDAGNLFDAVDAAFAAYTDTMLAEAAFLGMLTLAGSFTAKEAPPAGIEQRTQAPSTPELRAAEATNAALFQSLARRLALRETGYCLPGIDLDNTERAERVRDMVAESFLAESNIAAADGNDVAYSALTSLAHRLLDDIDHRAAQLPSLAVYRTPRSFNAIVLAYQLYADAGRNLDLVARVGAFTPAFMPLTGRVLDR